MPYKNKSDRNLRREYDLYQGTEEQKKKRALRNAARNLALKKGIVKNGDGKDIEHIKPLSKGGTNKPSNLRVQKASDNRSFARNSDRSVK